MNDLIKHMESVFKFRKSKDKTYGFTVNEKGENPQSGYTVCCRPKLSKVIKIDKTHWNKLYSLSMAIEMLHTVANMPENNVYLGGWIDLENNFYLDIVHRFDSEKIAKQIAIDFGQKAYFDVINNKVIYI